MGSLAKSLGQWSRKSFKSESASLFKGLKANKVPGSLSLALDGTLKEGHNMKVFGAGTLASMSSRARYHRFLTNLQAVYATMEEELDAASIPAIQSDVIRTVWKPHEISLRRSDGYSKDLQDLARLDETTAESRVSHCTLQYLQAIRYAGEVDRETGSGRLLGHLYCRYLADLFGGQMLSKPYELALQLTEPPRHLQFNYKGSRKATLEHLYEDLNKAGKLLTKDQLEDVRKESLSAFEHNVKVYSEEKIVLDAVRGGVNLVLGWATSFPK